MFERLICFIFDHKVTKDHDFQKIVTCERCNRKVKAWYDFQATGYELA